MTRNRTARSSAKIEAAKTEAAKPEAAKRAPSSAPDDDRSPADYPRPADPMRASIAYSLRDPRTPGGAHVEVLRWSLFRKLMTVLGQPARCKDPACRRAKACAGPDIRCQHELPRRARTPEQEAESMAFLRRELRRRREESGRERAAAADAVKPAPAAASRRRNRAWSRNAGRP